MDRAATVSPVPRRTSPRRGNRAPRAVANGDDASGHDRTASPSTEHPARGDHDAQLRIYKL